MLTKILTRLMQGENLSAETTEQIVERIMSEEISPVLIASFLTALRAKGETTAELVGAARAMRNRAIRIPHQHPLLIDTCGTGGDGSGTFNISTTAAFVLAAAGLTVGKHGNRSISSRSGSADVLEALGARIDLTPAQVATCIERVGIGFMFAPHLHPAMKAVGPVRKELGFRTIFNMLGPLTNPAGATHQVIGVFAADCVAVMARAAAELGAHNVFVVHNECGLDELATCGVSCVVQVTNGTVRTFEVIPEEHRLARCDITDLAGGDPVTNAEITRRIFDGEPGPAANTVILNAALGLVCAEAANSLDDGIALARETIAGGRARQKLSEFIAFTNEASRAA
ncbi:anthranilate phosphoribosyltransferase [candidate division GN15 bacterium]|nr:anthranilate phosphoribosyltransferase [candidate division GN15 bacterium]